MKTPIVFFASMFAVYGLIVIASGGYLQGGVGLAAAAVMFSIRSDLRDIEKRESSTLDAYVHSMNTSISLAEIAKLALQGEITKEDFKIDAKSEERKLSGTKFARAISIDFVPTSDNGKRQIEQIFKRHGLDKIIKIVPGGLVKPY